MPTLPDLPPGATPPAERKIQGYLLESFDYRRREPIDVEKELNERNLELPNDTSSRSSSPVLCILVSSESIVVEFRRKEHADQWPAEERIDLAKWFLRCQLKCSLEWTETEVPGVYESAWDVEYQRVVTTLHRLAKYGMAPRRSGEGCSVRLFRIRSPDDKLKPVLRMSYRKHAVRFPRSGISRSSSPSFESDRPHLRLKMRSYRAIRNCLT